MTNMLSAQKVFNGEGFDDKHMLRKAERELNRLRGRNGFEAAYDHMMNLSVTLAAVADWTFHLKLSNLPRWSGKTSTNFVNWIRSSSDDAFVFIDISNEYKHADRNKPSTLAENMMISFIDLSANPEMRSQLPMNKGHIQKVGEADWYIFPSVKLNGQVEFIFDVAERAIDWWKNFTPASAQPMDIAGNVLP